MSAWMWWALAGAVWTAVSIAVGIGIGRAVRLREQRSPRPPTPGSEQ